MSAHCHLLQRLFASDIQRFHLLGQFAQRLQQQRGFPRTRGYRQSEWHFPATTPPPSTRSNSFKSGGKTRQLFWLISESFWTFATPALPGIAAETLVTRHRWRRSKTHLGDGVPGMTGTALPLPARIIGPAFITNKGAFWSFCHGVPR